MDFISRIGRPSGFLLRPGIPLLPGVKVEPRPTSLPGGPGGFRPVAGPVVREESMRCPGADHKLGRPAGCLEGRLHRLRIRHGDSQVTPRRKGPGQGHRSSPLHRAVRRYIRRASVRVESGRTTQRRPSPPDCGRRKEACSTRRGRTPWRRFDRPAQPGSSRRRT